jgi:membrane fusion protein, heavy metal efflux system
VSKRAPRQMLIAKTRTAALLVLAAFIGGCSSKPADSHSAPAVKSGAFTVTEAQRARLQIVTVAQSTFRPVLEVTGTVAFNGDHSTQVLSPMSGPVSRLLANPGTSVSEGQALATVSSPDFASAVAGYRKATEAARNTQRILKLSEQLFQNDALARSALDQARADAAAAAADVESAQQQLHSLGVDDATITALRDGKQAGPIEGAIRSPLTGTVVERLINPGQLLTAGTTPTFTVADLATMWVMANVYEIDLALASAGQEADVITDASPKPIPGRIDYVAALVDPATKATTVRIVAQNADHLLKRDMFVRVRIHSTRDRSGVLVPAAAVLRDEDNLPFVFVEKTPGTYERRRVTLGYHVNDRYEITTGLVAGEKVVGDGALFIQFAESQ